MNKIKKVIYKMFLLSVALSLFQHAALSYGQNDTLVELKGISLGMTGKELIDNWGFPAKREVKSNSEVWFYLNENTPQPTDGILVYIKKNKVEKWKLSENMYAEMEIWGRKPGVMP